MGLPHSTRLPQPAAEPGAVEDLSLFARRAGDALMAAASACGWSAGADGATRTFSQQHAPRADGVPIQPNSNEDSSVVQCNGMAGMQAPATATAAQLADNAVALAGMAGAARSISRQPPLTPEQRGWLYDLAVDVLNGNRSKPCNIDLCVSLGLEARPQVVAGIKNSCLGMRHRASMGTGPAVPHVKRKYRVRMQDKVKIALQSLLNQEGTIVDILQYIQGRVDWHDDMTWGRSLTHTAAGPTWHHETRKVVANVDLLIATGQKRGVHNVYRYDPTLDPATAPCITHQGTQGTADQGRASTWAGVIASCMPSRIGVNTPKTAAVVLMRPPASCHGQASDR